MLTINSNCVVMYKFDLKDFVWTGQGEIDVLRRFEANDDLFTKTSIGEFSRRRRRRRSAEEHSRSNRLMSMSSSDVFDVDWCDTGRKQRTHRQWFANHDRLVSTPKCCCFLRNPLRLDEEALINGSPEQVMQWRFVVDVWSRAAAVVVVVVVYSWNVGPHRGAAAEADGPAASRDIGSKRRYEQVRKRADRREQHHTEES